MIDLSGEQLFAPGDAPCFGQVDALFSVDEQERAQAAEVCRGCPKRQECYEAALARRETHGVWGGADFEGGRELRRRTRLVGRGLELAVELADADDAVVPGLRGEGGAA